MESLKRTTGEIINGVSEALQSLDTSEVEKMLDLLLGSRDRKILIIGAGRSGLVARAFAMRLMHLGFSVYIVGETITPALEEKDLFLAISGSGATTFVVAAADIAKRVGATVIAITSHPDSQLGKFADHIVTLKGRTKLAEKRDYFSRQIMGVYEPLAPLGTLFETSCAIFLDGVIVELMQRLKKTEEDLKKRHATIE